MLSEHEEYFALLDQAAETLRDYADVSRPHVLVCLHYYDLDTLQEQSAVCYRVAGQIDAAIGILEEKIGKLPQNLARDRGHPFTKLAVAVAQSPHPLRIIGGCDPHRPRRAGAADEERPVLGCGLELPSSPTPEGRCCGHLGGAVRGLVVVAILTDPGRPVLRQLPDP